MNPVIDYFDIRYYANISIGSPAQEFRVRLCTAGAEFWVISKDCTKEYCDKDKRTGYEHHKYDPDKSSTHEFDGRYYKKSYDGGMVVGHYAKDTLNLGSLTIKNQPFGSVDTLSGFLASEDNDGIMGLGWPSKEDEPPLYNVLHSLDQPLFTVWLARHDQIREGEAGGAITYGGLDKLHCGDDIKFVELKNEPQSSWKLKVDSVWTEKVRIAKEEWYISDTASPFTYVPSAIFKDITSKIEVVVSGGYYTVNCDAVKQLKSVTYTIGGHNYTVPASELVLEMQEGGSKCVLAVTNDEKVLGEPFIRRYCHVYDYGSKRIGLTESKKPEPLRAFRKQLESKFWG
ncbi:unnamed protein product [Bursaphelenchus xylophilus]|uniref:(pine wood nematode) hypothetical protein n=1 Tax=Bursaphelenchus xylophilus TaxID=6326 RepID=A0A1I7RJ78_BURXY|nr:unnamed protein product [Bursaphelenchus xylophilus]CAG9119441.1 unnamed protein product [Bursaphelenchus xylophilus]